ncbi:MAG TPA: methylmalonyl-CoA epimerase [Gemmatimonadaceae bacterium]|jgi:methylmalonyl-CoA/ethylmalonyl-CoA epimerase|nr:methylmalonyl-CoA epimerase [Gemmatimonadaceae bacterium]
MQPATPDAPKISHIGIAVRSIVEALPFYKEILGMPEVELSDSDGARIAGVDADGTLVELLEPESQDSPIGKFLAKRGPGIHHICFAVGDLDATLARCKKAGIRLIDEEPRIGAEGKRIAFLHPASTAGILVELTDP